MTKAIPNLNPKEVVVSNVWNGHINASIQVTIEKTSQEAHTYRTYYNGLKFAESAVVDSKLKERLA